MGPGAASALTGKRQLSDASPSIFTLEKFKICTEMCVWRGLASGEKHFGKRFRTCLLRKRVLSGVPHNGAGHHSGHRQYYRRGHGHGAWRTGRSVLDGCHQHCGDGYKTGGEHAFGKIQGKEPEGAERRGTHVHLPACFSWKARQDSGNPVCPPCSDSFFRHGKHDPVQFHCRYALGVLPGAQGGYGPVSDHSHGSCGDWRNQRHWKSDPGACALYGSVLSPGGSGRDPGPLEEPARGGGRNTDGGVSSPGGIRRNLRNGHGVGLPVPALGGGQGNIFQ